MESQEALAQVQQGGPYVVCAMHLGNWELLAGVSARLARPLAGVYQPLSNPKVDEALVAMRAPLYPLGLFPRSPATLRKLMKIARDGGSVGFMADLREGKGAQVPFFGRPAWSNTAPALIARNYGLKLYAACIVRQPGVRFAVRVAPVEVPVTGRPRRRHRSPPPPTSTRNSRFSCARRRSNGCGRTGAGIEVSFARGCDGLLRARDAHGRRVAA